MTRRRNKAGFVAASPLCTSMPDIPGIFRSEITRSYSSSSGAARTAARPGCPSSASSTIHPRRSKNRRIAARTGASSSMISTRGLRPGSTFGREESGSSTEIGSTLGVRRRSVAATPNGSRTLKRAPCSGPGRFSAVSRPPCCSTMPRETESPRPVPWPAARVVKNGSKIRGSNSGRIPLHYPRPRFAGPPDRLSAKGNPAALASRSHGIVEQVGQDLLQADSNLHYCPAALPTSTSIRPSRSISSAGVGHSLDQIIRRDVLPALSRREQRRGPGWHGSLSLIPNNHGGSVGVPVLDRAEVFTESEDRRQGLLSSWATPETSRPTASSVTTAQPRGQLLRSRGLKRSRSDTSFSTTIRTAGLPDAG